ncbi:TPA: endolysin, partial [Enterococcus faecium]|nr:endolysin [Enterococcus faecium]
MNGIDISSHQTGIDLSKVPCDFVIIKATGGTGYVNPDCDRAFQQALALGKKIGV